MATIDYRDIHGYIKQQPRLGWQCPLCGRGVSPDILVCPCGELRLGVLPVALQPYTPHPDTTGTWGGWDFYRWGSSGDTNTISDEESSKYRIINGNMVETIPWEIVKQGLRDRGMLDDSDFSAYDNPPWRNE